MVGESEKFQNDAQNHRQSKTDHRLARVPESLCDKQVREGSSIQYSTSTGLQVKRNEGVREVNTHFILKFVQS